MSVLAEQTFTNQQDTRDIVDEVMQNAFESVCSTMGPNGRYVVINQTNRPKVTKDGVSVAKALDFNEARRNLIAKIITEPSIKTDNEVGDGTTTTVFQTFQLYNKFKDKMSFKNLRYLDQLIRDVKAHIATLIIESKVTDDKFRAMLMTSSNYEESIVETILEIFSKYDKPNISLIRTPALKKDEIDLTNDIFFEAAFGFDQMNSRLGSKGFVVDPHGALIVLVDDTIRTVHPDSLSLMSNVDYARPVLLVARNFESNALQEINRYNSEIDRQAIVPIQLSAAGRLGAALFEDLGTLLGAKPIFDLRTVGKTDVYSNEAGFVIKARGIYIDASQEYVVPAIEEIVKPLDERYEALSVVERATVIGNVLFSRISRLRANNITIRVTGVTDSDTSERYYRYEDVMKAARTGLQYGVLPGIGYAYMEASKFVKALPQQSDEGLEQLRQDLADLLTYQYTYLTGIEQTDADYGKYVDLVTGEVSDQPTAVFDNAAATMIALEGAWATAKTLSKINNVMGRSNQSY
ncbi:GroEL-like type I chaperonin [Erwinia phage AH04]|uniref:GroEL-like type I chaperonin n=1 Tax=Erwinia phage AH04 TaxID=2869569 RepID=A0AAE7X118_9CAUD|nr:chaperonin groEL [Erwinia phage AH04]QZA70706.1 GroEL-like type I chaperonin [Erwinia phage AH04]